MGLLVAAAGQSRGPKPLAAGALLVAGARVPDGRFRQAVVLLVYVSEQGAAGLILNQPGGGPLPKLFPKDDAAKARTDSASIGGPVGGDNLFCLLRRDGQLREARAVLPGIYFSTSRDLMQLALNARLPPSSFRVFQGYSGWNPGQLQRELAAGLWTVLPGSAAIIFDTDPGTLWTRLHAAGGGASQLHLIPRSLPFARAALGPKTF
ncbi:MAG: YqgE/AlgH family protein [Terriglobales bacterium]